MFGLLQITIFYIFWKWEPLLDSPNFAISGRIWTSFFLKICQNLTLSPNIGDQQDLVWYFFTNQKKGEYLPQMELSEQVKGIFGIP